MNPLDNHLNDTSLFIYSIPAFSPSMFMKPKTYVLPSTNS